MHHKFALTCLLIFLVPFVARAQKQPLVFDKVTHQNGRSFGSVMGIERDANGFLWLATRSGLYRYDGYQTRLFKHDPGDSTSLPFNDITYMYKDLEGIFWLRHYDRFVPFKNEERIYDHPTIADLSFDFNAKLIEDAHRNLWVSSGEKGLAKYNKDSQKLTWFRHHLPLYTPTIKEKIRTQFSASPFARLEVQQNNTDTILPFRIEKQGNFLVYVSAEIHKGNVFDSGWISYNQDTIFQVQPSRLRHAGGNPKNRMQLQLITLKPGNYKLHYRTDNSHSPEHWVGEAPDQVPFYGIGLLKLTQSRQHFFQETLPEKYLPPHALASRNIKDMLLGADSTLWLLTDQGLANYLPKEDCFHSISLPYEKYFGVPFSLEHLVFCQMKNGRFWIGSQKGLVHIDVYTGEHRVYQNNDEKQMLTGNRIISLFLDHQDRLWAGTDQGLNLYHPKKDTFYHYRASNNNKLYGNRILGFFQDPSGNIWIASQEGLNKLRNKPFRHHFFSIERFGSFPVAMDPQGDFWYRGEENHLLHYCRDDHTTEHHQLPKRIFPFNHYNDSRDFLLDDMVADDEGIVWLAVGNRLIGYDPGRKEILHEMGVSALQVDKDSIRSTIHRIFVEPGGVVRTFSLKGISTFGIAGDRTMQTLPFGHDYEQIEAVDRNYIKSVIRDRRGNYWMRTAKGIQKYVSQNNTLQCLFQFSEELQGTPLLEGNLAQGPGGKIWCCAFPHLIAIDPDSLTVQMHELSCERETGTLNVFADSTGIWLYSTNGVFHYDLTNQILEPFTTKEGLADNAINGITRDDHNNIWLTSYKGLTKIAPDRKSMLTFFTPGHYPAYYFRDFPDEMNRTGDELLFFHSRGFLTYHPDSINMHPPPVVITGFSVFGTKQQFDTLVFNKRSIALPFDQNHFSIEFAALDYADPMKNSYIYQLVGVDKGWNTSPAYDRKASYTTVPPGHYTFKVKASNNHGIWNNEGVELMIHIAPPWYRTTLAYIIYGILIITGIYVFIKLRERRLIYEKKVLEEKVQERTARIEQQKEEITTQRDQIAVQNKNIRDSIIYANTIQTAALPPQELFEKLLPEHFIFFKPRDIVSGDFYWINRVDGKVVLVVADCTGHGVPGAFMSMLGIAFLNDIVSKIDQPKADDILNQLRMRVVQLLHQQSSHSLSNDGMDLALCIIDQENQEIQYAGAYNGLYLIRDGVLTRFKADQMPIGHYVKISPFTQQQLAIRPGDVIYLFSDGYIDQFSGKTGKKFKTKRFKELLLQIYQYPMHEQHQMLSQALDQWKGDAAQIDDILVVGVRF
jgi:ligand-binding sensor domain-containing protein/serine phosphatase RsbU (regulator of sigma subunit)